MFGEALGKLLGKLKEVGVNPLVAEFCRFAGLGGSSSSSDDSVKSMTGAGRLLLALPFVRDA